MILLPDRGAAKRADASQAALDNSNEASIVMITPPDDAIRHKQGNKVWGNNTTPLRDPKNYEGPNG